MERYMGKINEIGDWTWKIRASRIYIHKKNCSKTLHLLMEVNDHIVEQLIGKSVSMSIMFAHVVWGLGIMYLIIGNETYKTTLGVVI